MTVPKDISDTAWHILGNPKTFGNEDLDRHRMICDALEAERSRSQAEIERLREAGHEAKCTLSLIAFLCHERGPYPEPTVAFVNQIGANADASFQIVAKALEDTN